MPAVVGKAAVQVGEIVRKPGGGFPLVGAIGDAPPAVLRRDPVAQAAALAR
jgi:hypothetical protein